MAIAYDATSSSAGSVDTGNTTASVTHVCTGSNRVLFASISYDNRTGDIVPTVTYNGVSLSLIDKQAASNGHYVYLLYLANPASGSNSLSVSSSGVNNLTYITASSFTGARSAGVPDSTAKAAANTASVATVSDNDWIVCAGYAGSGGIGAGSSMAQRSSVASAANICDSSGAITPAGSVTRGISSSGIPAVVLASFSPVLFISASDSQPSSDAASTLTKRIISAAESILMAEVKSLLKVGWNFMSRHASSWADRAKSSSTFSNRSKSSTSWTDQNKS